MSIFLNFFSNIFKTNNNFKQNINQTHEWYIDFNNLKTFDCIIPTKNLNFCHIQDNLSTLISTIEKSIHKCILIYDNNTDNLIGIVYESDIINTLVYKNKKDGCDFTFSHIEFSPYTMDVNEALNYMYENNIKDLIIVDSKGVTLGLFNIQSVINFLYDYEKYKKYFIVNENNNSIKIDATILLKHIPENWQIKEFYDCYKSGTRTLGGFLGYYTGEILRTNTEITINILTFKVIESDDKFIKTIEMIKKDSKKNN